MTKLKVTDLPPGSLKPYDRNARTHSPKQVAQIAVSIEAFGFNNPVLIDKDGGIIAGIMSVLKVVALVFFPELSTIELGRIEVDRVPPDRLQ